MFQQLEASSVPSSIKLHMAILQRVIQNHTDLYVSNWGLDETTARIEQFSGILRKFELEWLSMSQNQLSHQQLIDCSDFYTKAEEMFLVHKMKLGVHLKLITTSTPAINTMTPINNQAIQIQLSEPPKVPKFSGLEVDWANFRAIYEAEIDNNTRFSDAQKMRYLLSALQGRAEIMYKNWPIGDGSSYKKLWSEICMQYGNEYNTIRAHLQTMASIQPLQKPSCESMRTMLDTVRSSFNQLQLIVKPEQIGEHILLYQLEQMLDMESRVQWSLHRPTNQVPTLQQMFVFLESRASILSQIQIERTTSLGTTVQITRQPPNFMEDSTFH